MNETKEALKQKYLKQFGREDFPEYFGESNQVVNTGMEIVDDMKKRDLTYDEAYASLKYAYDVIKYESNFLKIR